ncbi:MULTISPECIES: M20/M25/M40 family metallo-hydrolase [Arsenicicoccus]|uniref:M20/M25/M40 family metallo-hydrolase n=1 Tax=Arsenicicoccus TaxID=267408 RepID=UPI00257E94A8|nr:MULTISPECIES: M20/M25/M40 family metallo-hydrolase [Arsenicicoccus]
MDLSAARDYAREAMPRLLEDHATLVGHPSVAFPGYPREPMDAIAQDLLEMFRRNGVPDVELLDIPGGYPAIHAVVPGPEGSPTVTMYAHYDVQPCPESQQWHSDPWVATRKDDGRIYGRGTADCKAGVVAILGTMGAFDGTPPCTVRLLLEGEEETFSHIEDWVAANPDMVRSDAFIICDSGPAKVGEPSITSGLRGDVAFTVTLTTLDNAVHSGLFGGAAPDALVGMIQLLSTMHDKDGNTVIEGLHSFDWEGAEVDESEFAASAGVKDGVGLQGTGPLASRLWSRPSATVIGLDMVPVDQCSNALVPSVRARVSVRIAPGADMARELETVKEHLRSHAPYGATLEFSDDKAGSPFLGDTSGPIAATALAALEEVYGRTPAQVGSGGSIPLVTELLHASPGAEAILWGPEDEEKAKIHGPDESVDPAEIERIMLAQIRFLSELGSRR